MVYCPNGKRDAITVGVKPGMRDLLMPSQAALIQACLGVQERNRPRERVAGRVDALPHGRSRLDGLDRPPRAVQLYLDVNSLAASA